MAAKLTKGAEDSWSFGAVQGAGTWQKSGLVDEL